MSEVVSWCSLQTLTDFHQDSPDEARRREMLGEAGRLLDGYYSWNSMLGHLPNWLQKHLPSERRWTRAMTLFREADPDSLAPLEHQLRSSVLKPAESIGEIYDEEQRKTIVDGVIGLRSALIHAHCAEEATPPSNRLEGRLLLYVPSENVSDGASRYASKGFFDPDDCPPWDSWLLYSDRTLISWVPAVLVPLAQAGIDANAVECIQWAE